MRIMVSLLVGLGRCALALRYRVKIDGLEAVAARGTRGILFLANHPALIDPLILLGELHGRFHPRTLADKDRITIPVLGWIARKGGAIPMPTLTRYGGAAREEVEQAILTCAGLLKAGDNVMVYPAGHLMSQRLTELGGNSAVETLLKAAPDTRVVLIRTQGLWGSRFSRVHGRPDFLRRLREGLGFLAANFLFFSPRREVLVTFAEPLDLPRTREAMNRRLEAFYNEDAPAALQVPHTLWEGGGPRPLPEPVQLRLKGDPSDVPLSTRQLVLAQLERMVGRVDCGDTVELARDLGFDSLMRLELQTWIEQEFAHPVSNPESLWTVGDLMLAASGQSLDPGGLPLAPVPSPWFKPKTLPVLIPPGDTLAEVFLAQAARQPGGIALADQGGGLKSYRDIVTALFALRPFIQGIEGPYVGIMLPASAGAAVLFLAVSCAGKIPVMVNWTTGTKNLIHGLDLLGVTRVLTAGKLLANLQAQGMDLSPLGDRLLPMEQVGASLGKAAKLKAFIRSHLSWRELRQPAPATAVVLFTSGSESLPKAVPLTHGNLLANLRDLIEGHPWQPDERMLGFLPPFHAFGLSCGILLPLCGGMRSVYHPVPTDGGILARHIDAYGVTTLVGTPTFLNGIVRAARDPELRTLRFGVTGAEKCPAPLFATIRLRWPALEIMEGYGITECSPVVSCNRAHRTLPGTVGPPLPSLTIAVVDLEVRHRVEPGGIGMLLLRGPSVFGGYLGQDAPQPFVRFEGECWYRTGDLVRENEAGHLIFSGRLKRFVKLGGEMVSLPAVEEALQARFALPEDSETVLAVEALEQGNHTELILFATHAITREEANQALRQAGFSAIHNIRSVWRLPQIPLLGTGKPDYRALKALLTAPSA